MKAPAWKRPLAMSCESFAADGGRVMEGGAQRDVAIVDAVGIESDLRVGGAAAEEVDRAALAHQLDGFLPGFGRADGLNGDVDAAIFGGEGARFADGLANGGGLHDMRGAELPRRFNLAVVLDDGDGFKTGQRGDVKNHEAQRAAANDGDDIALARMGVLESVHGAGQRLSERGVLEGDILRNDERVLGDDARGNLDELSVGAVVEEQIVAKILLAAQAEISTGRRARS